MLTKQFLALLLTLRAFFCGCGTEAKPAKDWSKPYPYARMAALVQESSALEYAGQGHFYTLADGGNPALLYKFTSAGKVLDSLPTALRNRDWESLAQDSAGNLYIGDFGNNLSRRRQLFIYKITPRHRIDTIRFSYPEQEDFSPPKELRNFDCEAMYWWKGELHLFTKAWGSKEVVHYSLPDTAGLYTARYREAKKLKDLVTAADISPDGKTAALLTYGKVYFFDVSPEGELFSQAPICLRKDRLGQSEALLFISNRAILLSNETGRLFYAEKLRD